MDRRLVGTAFIHRHLIRHIVIAHGLFKKMQGRCLVALGRQQKIDRFAFFVSGAIEIFPDALDLDIGLVHPPTRTHRTFVLVEKLIEDRQRPAGPTADSGMVNQHPALYHHLLKMPVAQRIRRVPANAYQNPLDRKSHPFHVQHIGSPSFKDQKSTQSPSCWRLTRPGRPAATIFQLWIVNATEP